MYDHKNNEELENRHVEHGLLEDSESLFRICDSRESKNFLGKGLMVLADESLDES
jgi:hypothetical protein